MAMDIRGDAYTRLDVSVVDSLLDYAWEPSDPISTAGVKDRKGWEDIAKELYEAGDMTPLVQLLVSRTAEPVGLSDSGTMKGSPFFLKNEKPVYDWLLAQYGVCRDDVNKLEGDLGDLFALGSGAGAGGAGARAGAGAGAGAGAASRARRMRSSSSDDELNRQYAALTARVAHIFSVFRALLVRRRCWMLQLAEGLLEGQLQHPSAPGARGRRGEGGRPQVPALLSVPSDASLDRIRTLLTDARNAADKSLKTMSVDAVVEDREALLSLCSELLARIQSCESELSAISEEEEQASNVFNQRQQQLEALQSLYKNPTASQAHSDRMQQAEDVRKQIDDLKERMDSWRNSARVRNGAVDLLARETRSELSLLSWLLVAHHLRRRVALGRWVMASVFCGSCGQHSVPDFPDLFRAVNVAVQDPSNPSCGGLSSESFVSALWAAFRASCAADDADANADADTDAEYPPTPASLPRLLEKGSGSLEAALKRIIDDGPTADDASPAGSGSGSGMRSQPASVTDPRFSPLVSAAFDSHESACVFALYSSLTYLVQAAAPQGTLAQGKARGRRSRTSSRSGESSPAEPPLIGRIKSTIGTAIVSFSQAVGTSLDVGHAVLVLVLMDVAAMDSSTTRPSASQWMVQWALELFKDPSLYWPLDFSRPLKLDAGSDASNQGIAYVVGRLFRSGAVGTRLLQLDYAEAAVARHRALWPEPWNLSVDTAMLLVNSMIGCGFWSDAFEVAKGIEDNATLLRRCFRWMAEQKKGDLLRLPLNERESLLLEEELTALAHEDPKSGADKLHIMYRISRFQSIEGMKPAIPDPRLDAVVQHYQAKCMPPPAVSCLEPRGARAGTAGGAPPTAEAKLSSMDLRTGVPTGLASRLQAWRTQRVRACQSIGPRSRLDFSGDVHDPTAALPSNALVSASITEHPITASDLHQSMTSSRLHATAPSPITAPAPRPPLATPAKSERAGVGMPGGIAAPSPFFLAMRGTPVAGTPLTDRLAGTYGGGASTPLGLPAEPFSARGSDFTPAGHHGAATPNRSVFSSSFATGYGVATPAPLPSPPTPARIIAGPIPSETPGSGFGALRSPPASLFRFGQFGTPK